MGVVYLTRPTGLNRPVALKVVPGGAADPRAPIRFLPVPRDRGAVTTRSTSTSVTVRGCSGARVVRQPIESAGNEPGSPGAAGAGGRPAHPEANGHGRLGSPASGGVGRRR